MDEEVKMKDKTRKLDKIIVITFLTCLIMTSDLRAESVSESNLYTNQEFGISIKGPAGWHTGSDIENNVLVNFDNIDSSNPARIGLQYFDNRQIASFHDYANSRVAYKQKTVKTILLLEFSEIELNGIESFRAIYEVPKTQTKIIEYYFRDSNRNLVYYLHLLSPKGKFEENKKILKRQLEH